MKKFLNLVIIAIMILVYAEGVALADDFVEFKNEQDHYRFLIPGSLNYQDVSGIRSLENTSFVAVDIPNGVSICVDKIPEVLFFPSDRYDLDTEKIFWNQALRKEYIGYKLKEVYALRETGTFINKDRKFYWEKYESAKQMAMIYHTFNHGILYKIQYVYKKNDPVDQENIVKSINSFRFYGSDPLWVKIFSPRGINIFADLNNITERLDPSDNKKYKVIIYKMIQADGIIENSIGLKKINNTIYYKIFSSSRLTNNEQVQEWQFFADQDWNIVDENGSALINKIVLGIVNVLDRYGFKK